MFPKSFFINAENALSYLFDLDRFKNIIYEKFQESLALTFQKYYVICPLNMMKSAFYFTLKDLFVFKIFKFLSVLFSRVDKTVCLER